MATEANNVRIADLVKDYRRAIEEEEAASARVRAAEEALRGARAAIAAAGGTDIGLPWPLGARVFVRGDLCEVGLSAFGSVRFYVLTRGGKRHAGRSPIALDDYTLKHARRTDPCDACAGKGEIDGSPGARCRSCDGLGVVPSNVTIGDEVQP